MAVAGLIRIGMSVSTQMLEKGMQRTKKVLDSVRAPGTRFVKTIQSLGNAARKSAKLLTMLVGAVTGVGVAYRAVTGAVSGAIGMVSGFVAAASEQSDAMSFASHQFQDGFGAIENAADDAAKTLGVVRAEFYRGAAAMGDVVAMMGKGSEETAQLSAEITRLASDFSAVRGGDFNKIVQDLRLGLTGRRRPLQRLGLFLNRDMEDAKAYELGIARVGEELTEAQRIQARYALIMDQTSRLHGEAEAGILGVSSSISAMQGRLQNMRAAIGEAFQSLTQTVLIGASEVIFDITQSAEGFTDAIKEWVDAGVRSGGIINEAVGYIGEGIEFLVRTVDYLRIGFKAAQLAVTSFALGGAIVLKDLIKPVEWLNELLTGTKSSFYDAVDATIENLSELAKKQAESLTDQESAAGKVSDVFDRIRAKMNQLGAVTESAGGPLNEMLEDAEELLDVTEQIKQAEKDRFAEAMEFGSNKARELVINAMGGRDDSRSEEIQLARQQVNQSKMMVDELRRLGGAILDRAVQEVVRI